jgi:protein SCO1/2
MTAGLVRIAVLALAGLAAGALAAVAVLPEARERLFPGSTVRTTGQALIGGPFALTDHTGRRVTDPQFRGRTLLVLFGHTSSADMTPSALQVLSAALDRLGPKAARFAPVLITVDPEHDTPARLATYVARFHPRLVGLTGTPAEVARVLEAYRIRSVRKRDDPQSPGGYTVDHPARIYVMDGQGRFRTLLNPTAGVDAVAAGLKSLL